jgi:hypothetical protein
MEMAVTPRRPPLPPLVCMRFPEYASFSVLRETPVPFSSHHFKKLKCYQNPNLIGWQMTKSKTVGLAPLDLTFAFHVLVGSATAPTG